MPGLSVEELIEIYKEKDCTLELRNRTWCLCRNGKIINRITSKKKLDEIFKYIYKN